MALADFVFWIPKCVYFLKSDRHNSRRRIHRICNTKFRVPSPPLVPILVTSPPSPFPLWLRGVLNGGDCFSIGVVGGDKHFDFGFLGRVSHVVRGVIFLVGTTMW